MNKYEMVAIYSLKNGEEATEALSEKFKALIEANGTVESIDVWGKRRLAYPINDEVEAFYVLYNFECGVDFPAELDRVSKITDGVLRTLIVRKSETTAVPAKAAEGEKAAEAAETAENA
ncbi:MAG: 30S ribosomal protein S6 [Candidatus Howiella sp.]|jgi:small subunit ribosomal protein S6